MVEVVAELAKSIKPLRRCVQSFGLSLEDLPPVSLYQHSEHLTHAPARRPNHLQAAGGSAEQRDAAVAQDSYTVWVTVEGLQLKSIQIKTLQLLSGIRHGYIL